MKRFFLLPLAVVAFLASPLLLSCSGGDDEAVTFTKFEVSPDQIETFVGYTEQITITTEPVVDLNGSVRYSILPGSSNPTAVSISESGLVTGVEEGECTIVVSSLDGRFYKKIPTIVNAAPVAVASFVIDGEYDDPANKSVNVDSSDLTLQFTATMSPLEASVKGMAWSLENNTSDATIDENGLLTLGSTGGVVDVVATLTAFDDTLYIDRVKVTINHINIIPVSSIVFDFESKKIVVGETYTLNPTFEPAEATIKEATYLSENTDVATIDANSGKITAISAGTTTITATAADGSEVTAPVTIEVVNGIGLPDIEAGGSTLQ